MLKFVCLGVLATVALGVPTDLGGADILPLDVMTSLGPIKGRYDGHARQFLNVPYAAPPTDANRFLPPQAASTWTSTLACDSPTKAALHICPQLNVAGLHLGSEDCLYLNVYTPSKPSDEPLPVMVWLYGGGYVFGDGGEFHLYNGAKMARDHDVIVVAMNYRLGPLGFMASDALKTESNTTGNYALLDQQAALRWVQANAAAFGGSPNNVTIFGESAGGFSVCWHLAAPSSAGLFHAAIMESGTCDSAAFFQTYANATAWSEEYVGAHDCDRKKLGDADFLACIRKLPLGELMQNKVQRDAPRSIPLPPLFPVMPWGPAIDSDTLPDVPLNLLRAGRSNQVPLILGTNHNEGSVFIPAETKLVPDAHFPMHSGDLTILLNHFMNSTTTSAVRAIYDNKGFHTTDSEAAIILRDFFFACAARRTARALSAYNVPVFLYQFRFDFGGPEYKLLGDFHASELNFVWGNGFPPLVGIWDKKHKEMSEIFQTFWTNMAKTRNPNTGSPAPAAWPRYNATSDENIFLDLPTTSGSNLLGYECDFWDTHPAWVWQN